jgi:hypothetical protein
LAVTVSLDPVLILFRSGRGPMGPQFVSHASLS